MPTLAVHYNLGLVFVSVLISMATSYAVLSLSDRARAATTRRHRHLWLTCGAVAMGVGIWSMHYFGMLAVERPEPTFYSWPTVVLSLLLAIAAAKVALTVAAAEDPSRLRLLLGGVLMGSAIVSMHWAGIASMRSSATEQFNLLVVALSIGAAVAFSCAALWIAFASRHSQEHVIRTRLAASWVMGIGIASMHSIVMTVTRFTLYALPLSTWHTVNVGVLGETAIAMMTILVFLMALGTSTLDKWRFQDLKKANADLIVAQQALLGFQQKLTDANAKLVELSVRDGLTGLYNRRHFDGALDMELRRAARNLKPISLLVVDVDQFKSLNDSYGHQRGDDCLRKVARVLESLPRRGYDVVARYGGEEFVLLLPNADGLGALAIAELIRYRIAELNIENLGSTVAPIVTVSIGVCCQHPHVGDGSESLIREADYALYEAKRLGRNRVEIFTQYAAPPVPASV